MLFLTGAVVSYLSKLCSVPRLKSGDSEKYV